MFTVNSQCGKYKNQLIFSSCYVLISQSHHKQISISFQLVTVSWNFKKVHKIKHFLFGFAKHK